MLVPLKTSGSPGDGSAKLNPPPVSEENPPAFSGNFRGDGVDFSAAQADMEDLKWVGTRLYNMCMREEEPPSHLRVESRRIHDFGEMCYCPRCAEKFGLWEGGWVPKIEYTFSSSKKPGVLVKLTRRDLHYMREGILEFQDVSGKLKNLSKEYEEAKVLGIW